MAEQAHPMRDHNKNSSEGGYSFNFARIKNPITEQIKDTDDLREGLHGYKLIPYSGEDDATSDSLQKLFNKLRFISKTLGACWFSIKSFALGSKLGIISREDPDFDYGDEEVVIDPAIKRKFKEEVLDKIKYGKNLGAKRIAENCFDDHFDNGNYWLEVVLSSTGEVKGALIDYHHSETVKKAVTDKGIEVAVISKKFELSYLTQKPPRVLPLAPNAYKQEDGTVRTMIHCKNGNFEHYGRPVYIGAFLPAFRQYQDDDYLIKIADKMFVGQGVLEYESDDPEFDDTEDNNNVERDEEDGLINKIEKNFTAEGNVHQSILVMERPKGSTPFKYEQIKANLNENFFEKQGGSHSKAIFENLGYSERLLGNNVGGAFAADSFISELKIKDKGVLRFYREKSVEGLNQALLIIDNFLTGGQYSFLSVAFKPLFEGEDQLKTDETKKVIETIGIGVRAGVITPTKQLEDYVRNLVKLPEMAAEAIAAWSDDKNVRRPITLKGQDDIEQQALIDKNKLQDE